MEIVLFAVLAVFLFLRLWSVLGMKQDRVTQTQTIEEGPLSPLEKIKRKDPDFSEVGFIESAKKAFRMITKAYATNDLETLEKLTTKELYDCLSKNRTPTQEPVIHQLNMYIQDIGDDDYQATISVLISSSQNNNEEIQDFWVFSNDYSNPGSYWRLSDMRAIHDH